MAAQSSGPSVDIPTQMVNQFKEYVMLRDDLPDVVALNYATRGYVNAQDSKRVTYIRYGGRKEYGRNKKVDGFTKIKLDGQVLSADIKEFTSSIQLTNYDIQTQRENLVKVSASILKSNMVSDIENDLYLSMISSAEQYDCKDGSVTDTPSNLSEDDVRNIELLLDKANCRRITPYIMQKDGASFYNVNNIPSSYVFIVPTEAQRKLKSYIPNLKTPNEYGWNMVPYARELGSISNTRIIASNYLDTYAESNSSDQGKTVYTGFMFGYQAFGAEIIQDLTQIFFQDPKFISPGGMTGYITSKIFGSTVILNKKWIKKVKFVTE